MARKVTISVVDDLDGSSAADETVEFWLDGVRYEIDLSTKNAAKLRSTLTRWVDAGRRIGGRRREASVATRGGHLSAGLSESAAIRDWARRNGLDIAARGRIPAHIIDAFQGTAKR
jgi:hypothetical protein